jgi:hypothetical protein
MEQHRLPFTITDVYAGFARVDGFLVVDKIQKRKVRYRDIEAVEFKNGWFSSWIEFRAKTMRTFTKFPHKDRTMLRVAIEKKHRKAMKAALSEIDLRRSYADADRLLDRGKRRQGRKASARAAAAMAPDSESQS